MKSYQSVNKPRSYISLALLLYAILEPWTVYFKPCVTLFSSREFSAFFTIQFCPSPLSFVLQWQNHVDLPSFRQASCMTTSGIDFADRYHQWCVWLHPSAWIIPVSTLAAIRVAISRNSHQEQCDVSDSSKVLWLDNGASIVLETISWIINPHAVSLPGHSYCVLV